MARAELRTCAYSAECADQVVTEAGENEALNGFIGCILTCIADCVPTGECLELAECCRTKSQFTQEACIKIVENDEQNRCREARTMTFDCPN
jgi:hypothetical protein